MVLPPNVLAKVKRIVASYPEAPLGIENFLWLDVPRYWDCLRVPLGGSRATTIYPRREDRHAGVCFRVGWDAGERVVALWLL